MPSHVLLKVTRMAKVSTAFLAHKATLVEVNQHVIVQRMLPRKGRRAEFTDVRLQSGVLLVVKDKAVGRRKLLVRTQFALVDERLVAVDEHRLGS